MFFKSYLDKAFLTNVDQEITKQIDTSILIENQTLLENSIILIKKVFILIASLLDYCIKSIYLI